MADPVSDDESPKKEKLGAKRVSQLKEISTDTDCAWAPNAGGQDEHDENPVTWAPLEEIVDATNEDTWIDNNFEAVDCVGQYNEEGPFSQLSIYSEALKIMVAEAIRKELQGVLVKRSLLLFAVWCTTKLN